MWAPNTLIYVYFNFNLASADVQYQYVITFTERLHRREVSSDVIFQSHFNVFIAEVN